MRPILAFDTSAAHCAAAIYWQDAARPPVVHSEDMAKGQAECLLPMIEAMLAQSGLIWGDIGALGVGIGPGNFTGIRIAVALARGLALGLNIPSLGVTGFDARAFGCDLPDFWATIPAPRGQIYAQRFGQPLAPALYDTAPSDAPVLAMADLPPAQLALTIAQIAAQRAGQPCPRPAPFYLRAADAAPPSRPAPPDIAMTVEDMARLHHACFGHLRPWSAGEMADILLNPHSFALTRPEGFLIGSSVAGEAEVITLAVNPAARRQGIGRALVLEFLKTARQNGAARAFLEVAADNSPAIALYHTCGFAKAGLRRAYYHTAQGAKLDALVLSCPLLPLSPEI